MDSPLPTDNPNSLIQEVPHGVAALLTASPGDPMVTWCFCAPNYSVLVERALSLSLETPITYRGP